ncbi:dihydropyrimidinase [Hymenobacter sp. HMF4947]|uniref:Dihydropyrimidinase n=1 Tax=Hymenobacter ginkgonis TaxID=2682976 RepID=A0A7K1T9N0_9BACT|nr:dihydropyrimidinase [Hymenobacter ginkgonis]MVN75117.1 dihydropyrimidinase [Hymenobacter ginkgonis]
MSVLLQTGRVVTADSDSICDILVEGETIVGLGRGLPQPAGAQVIDCTGKLIVPGGIDPHVHLSMPFMGTFSSDDYETGTRAALHGGTTTVIDFILQKQGGSLRSAFEEWSGRATGNALGDYSFHMAVTDFNPDTKEEIQEMIAEGITSFKTFMAYKGALMIDDAQLVGLMQEVRKYGGLVTVHATNGDMIDTLVAQHRAQGQLAPLYHYRSQPEVTEAEASGRFADIANYTGVNAYIVHLTCEGALNQVRRATQRNQRVLVETCIQYLLLDASLYENEAEGAKWVMSPPLREKKDQATLWAGLNQGLVQVVGTDHCPFMWEQKLLGKDDFAKIPNGHPAVEHRMELLFSEGVNKGRITPQKFVEVTSTNAAKIFGMFPRKGTISIGADADLVIFDPQKKHAISAETHHMNCDYSAYEGWELTGKIDTVLLRGQVAVDAGETKVAKGYGRFIKRDKPVF